MTARSSGVRSALLAGFGLSLAATAAAAQPTPERPPATAEQQETAVEEVVVTAETPPPELDSPRFTQPLLDTPQSVTVLDDELLEEQGRRSLRDALRNVTGVSIQAGEGAPQQGGGDILTIRGFSARDDILVDGIADVGVYPRDPFNAWQIEVLKGPSSAYAGRGNTGGTVNIVSRLPTLDVVGEAEISLGTADLYRVSFDWGRVLDKDRGVAVRLNGVYHSSGEPGRDHVHSERWALAPSIAFGLEGRTQLALDGYHLQTNNQPDLGIPNARLASFVGSGFEGRIFPVDRSNYYGYASDYQDVTVSRITARLDHAFSDDAEVRSVVRYGRTHSDQVISAPIPLCRAPCTTNTSDTLVGAPTTVDATTLIQGFAKPRDQVEEILISQTDLSLGFSTGPVRHALVVGMELSGEYLENRRRIDRLGPALDPFNPVLTVAPDIPYQGTRARLRTDTRAVYLFDSLEWRRWEALAGARFDQVTTRAQGIDDTGLFPTYRADLTLTDRELSWNLGVLYKPVPEMTFYVAAATSFEPSGRADVVRTAGRNNNPPVTPAEFFIEPERARTVEVGARWDVPDGPRLAAAAFQIEKDNARTPGSDPGDPPIVSEGVQRVRGFEISADGHLTDAWDLFAGYTYLDGRTLSSGFAADRGRRLEYTPRHTVSLWTSYQLTDRLKLGGGLQHMSERVSEITNVRFVEVRSPAFTVADVFGEYKLNETTTLRLNVHNVTDEEYVQAFQNNHSLPAARRQAVLTLGVLF